MKKALRFLGALGQYVQVPHFARVVFGARSPRAQLTLRAHCRVIGSDLRRQLHLHARARGLERKPVHAVRELPQHRSKDPTVGAEVSKSPQHIAPFCFHAAPPRACHLVFSVNLVRYMSTPRHKSALFHTLFINLVKPSLVVFTTRRHRMPYCVGLEALKQSSAAAPAPLPPTPAARSRTRGGDSRDLQTRHSCRPSSAFFHPPSQRTHHGETQHHSRRRFFPFVLSPPPPAAPVLLHVLPLPAELPSSSSPPAALSDPLPLPDDPSPLTANAFGTSTSPPPAAAPALARGPAAHASRPSNFLPARKTKRTTPAFAQSTRAPSHLHTLYITSHNGANTPAEPYAHCARAPSPPLHTHTHIPLLSSPSGVSAGGW